MAAPDPRWDLLIFCVSWGNPLENIFQLWHQGEPLEKYPQFFFIIPCVSYVPKDESLAKLCVVLCVSYIPYMETLEKYVSTYV